MMLTKSPIATVEEFEAYFRDHIEDFLPYALEWLYAIGAGWDQTEFETLYQRYVWSTQMAVSPGDDASEVKGRPLEELGRYFLERGALAWNIREIREPGRWQVDGQGILNKKPILDLWGGHLTRSVGFQLYMEAKNHSESATNEEFAAHCRRMSNHDCQLGVFISTAGYRIGRGLGIAASIWENYLRDTIHLLLAFPSLYEVITISKAPLAVLSEVLGFAANNCFASDPHVQHLYSAEHCNELAQAEFQRLFLQDCDS